MAEQGKQPIQKRGGASAPTDGRRPSEPPKKPPDSGSSASPKAGKDAGDS